MNISEIGLCSGHSASGVQVDENMCTSIKGLYAAGDMANVPHNYMIGAFVSGRVAAEHAMDYIKDIGHVEVTSEIIQNEKDRIMKPLSKPNGIPHTQVEFKLRRFVNDYLQPPKSPKNMQIGLDKFIDYHNVLDEMGARDPHELMRCMEIHFIRDCAEMAAKASLFRTESRWGLYHYRLDFPNRNDDEWLCNTIIRKSEVDNKMTIAKQPLKPVSYTHLRAHET